jgi:hypothetical protein
VGSFFQRKNNFLPNPLSECPIHTFSQFETCVLAWAKEDIAGGAEHRTNTKWITCISGNVVGFENEKEKECRTTGKKQQRDE